MPLLAFAQANGKLQIHYMNVGQGDGAVLISPLGEVVLFDDGVLNQCTAPIAYLQSIGATHIDYHIASHYHSDHIGCAPQVFGAFPLVKAAYDRGGSYGTTTFSDYVAAVGAKRLTAVKGQSIVLDAGAASPVTITFGALSGNGIATCDANDLSLAYSGPTRLCADAQFRVRQARRTEAEVRSRTVDNVDAGSSIVVPLA